MELGITWNSLKLIINQRNIHPQYQELEDKYILGLALPPLDYICIIDKNTDDCTDFENNFKAQSNPPIKQHVLTEPANIALTLWKAPDIGIVDANSNVIVDLQLQPIGSETQQIIYGGSLHADNPGFEDHVKFQIIDKDNVLGYGANVIIKEYITKAYLNNNNSFEEYDEAGAYLPVGLYLRCIYTSTKTEGQTKFKINYLLGVPG